MANGIVVLLLIAALALAVRAIRRHRLLSSCGGDCGACPSGCKSKDGGWR